jgi:hypothetical protein
MELHELYEVLRASGYAPKTLQVDFGSDDDVTVHHCSCGYVTDKIEILAIHAVRVHNWPFEAQRVAGSNIVYTRFYEADDPRGPWTEITNPGGPRKRYVKRTDSFKVASD